MNAVNQRVRRKIFRRVDDFSNEIKEFVGAFVSESQAWAVRDGDVLATVTSPNDMPEPGTLLLTAAALLGLGVARRGRGKNQG